MITWIIFFGIRNYIITLHKLDRVTRSINVSWLCQVFAIFLWREYHRATLQNIIFAIQAII